MSIREAVLINRISLLEKELEMISSRYSEANKPPLHAKISMDAKILELKKLAKQFERISNC